MNSDHATIVRQVYDAFAQGDVPAVLGALDQNIHWQEAEGTVYAEGNPYIGPTAVLQGIFGRLAGEWDQFAVKPEEILATPEGALALGRYSATYKATGRRIDAQFAHVWRLADGKVTGFRQYTDTAQFNQAMGK